MKIYLLTHPREIPKTTNTGQLVLAEMSGRAERVIWSRVAPDAGLLNEISAERVALVYPGEEAVSVKQLKADLPEISSLILLDGTWQEARKMYNKSVYLHDLPRVAVNLQRPSRYSLRRNQLEKGLCTAECVAVLLAYLDETDLAVNIETALDKLQIAAKA